MSRSSGKRPKTGFAVWFVLIGFPVFGLVFLWELDLFGKAEAAYRRLVGSQPPSDVSSDVSTNSLSAFSVFLDRHSAVRLLSRPPRGGTEIVDPDCDWLSGRVSFRVAPTGIHRRRAFASFDIADAVAKGVAGSVSPSGRDLYDDWSIRTNAEDCCWFVDFVGVRPGGVLVLEVDGAKASVETRPPSLGRLAALWKRGRLSFASDGARINGRTFRRGDSLPPDPATGTPGFRVLGAASGCVWLEIVYSARSETVLGDRARWPRIEVGRTGRENGGGERIVRIEGTYELPEGKDVLFRERDRLVLRKGGILAANAVRFDYFGPDGHPPVDILVLCVH